MIKKIARNIIKAKKYILGIDKKIKMILKTKTTLNLYFNGTKANGIQINKPKINKNNVD